MRGQINKLRKMEEKNYIKNKVLKNIHNKRQYGEFRDSRENKIVLETIEEITLIYMYDKWVDNVKGIYWALKDVRRQ